MARTFVIGDIHGCWLELQDLLELAGITSDDTVVSVGDLVDRGPDPTSVVDWFRTHPNSVALMGNHERKHVRGILSYSQQVARLQLGEAYGDAVTWMAGLPYSYEDEYVRVVHFGHFPGVPLDEVPEDVRAGTTSGERTLRARYGDTRWHAHYDDPKPIAFGHHVVGDEALVVDGRVFGLDTGACHGGRLTGLLLPERRLVSVAAREDHWARVRCEWQVPVLRAEPWETWSFDKISRKVRQARSPRLPDGFLDHVEAWVAEVRSTIPSLAEALDRAVESLVAEVGDEGFGAAASAHPAGRWLLSHRRGRLSRSALGCSTPADVFVLAQALGVTPGPAPRP